MIQSQSKEQIESIQSQSNDAIDRTNKEASEHIENIETESAKKIEELQAKLKQALEQAEKDRIDKEKALEKAKANSLSHYIVNALRGRKAAADTSTDIVNAENDEHDKSDQKEDENK